MISNWIDKSIRPEEQASISASLSLRIARLLRSIPIWEIELAHKIGQGIATRHTVTVSPSLSILQECICLSLALNTKKK